VLAASRDITNPKSTRVVAARGPLDRPYIERKFALSSLICAHATQLRRTNLHFEMRARRGRFQAGMCKNGRVRFAVHARGSTRAGPKRCGFKRLE